MNIRLKLEHARRLGIQKEIGEIEKERMITQNDLELKESRSSWNLVNKKNAESEKQGLQLKADFAERKRILLSS